MPLIMAIQKGPINLEGQIGDLSFYRSNGKPQVRRRSGISKERIAKGRQYARTRENITEFGRASSVAKLIRVGVKLALGERYALFEDPSLPNRLTPRMQAIIRSDDIHDRGQRVVLPRHLALLHGFSFNAGAALKDVLFIPPRYTYRQDWGRLEVALPSFYPNTAMAVPNGTELCSFHVAALLFNANCEWLPFVAQQSELLPVNHEALPAQTFRLELPEASADPIILCFGISFYGKLGGYPVPIRDQGRNVFEVIGVSATDAG